MPVLRLTLPFLLLILTSGSVFSAGDTVRLDQGWRFAPGDHPSWAASAFDDSAWQPIAVDQNWDAQGYERLDGNGWYRLRFVLPDRILERDDLKDGVRITLGKINNFDQTFLNGVVLGANGKTLAAHDGPAEDFTKAPSSLWNVERVYVVPVDDPRLRWGAENVLSVRVFDESGLGGMWSGRQHLRAVELRDYLEIDALERPFDFLPRLLRKTFRVRNGSDRRSLEANLHLRLTGAVSGSIVQERRIPIDLAPRASRELVVECPRVDEAWVIEYRATFPSGEPLLFQEASPYILTPETAATPRINGPAVAAARPDHPFLFAIPASGQRPMRFGADRLPEGLVLDAVSGQISGKVSRAGTYTVTVSAHNEVGTTSRDLDIVIGDRLSLTPPMGWNSWNSWGLTVDEERVTASARSLVEKGLQAHGWSYVNVDDGWQVKGDSPKPKRATDGSILTNERFPDMKRLGDRLHSMGLKFGLYSSPGPLTCGTFTGSYEHEARDAKSLGEWKVDYLKYDWCSYDQIAKSDAREELMKPYLVMRRALDSVDRDIIYSLCQYGMGEVWEWGDAVGAQLWRTTEDITDTWESMSSIGFSQVETSPFAGPGRWNDPDMLVLGWVGWGPVLRPSRLTPDEQYTHMSLWCLRAAPLLLGCDLERLDPFTLSLLTNDEVLAVDQDRLGKQATPRLVRGEIQVWMKDLADGGSAIGVFNLGQTPASYALDMPSLGLSGPRQLRDLWRQRDLGGPTVERNLTIAPHGVVLLKATQAE